jgi:AraC-like DNA-binding protein
MGVIYPAWEATVSQIPPRSRFYNLEPVGLGSSNVESFTSYVSRLASAHCISPRILLTHECAPIVHVSLSTPRFFDRHWKQINGSGCSRTDWIGAFERLTRQDNLRFLTFRTFRNVLSPSHLIRSERAWCPLCLDLQRSGEHTIYEPLLWSLEAVSICDKHRCLLELRCRICQTKQKVLLTTYIPGYCANCKEWLGSSEVCQITAANSDDNEWSVWVSSNIGRLLAEAPRLSSPPTTEMARASLSRCIDRICGGNVSLFTRIVSLSRQTVDPLYEPSLQSLNSVLKICYKLGLSPLEFLVGQAGINETKREKLITRLDEREHLREVFLIALDEVPPPTIYDVCRRAGYRFQQDVLELCPDLFKALQLKRKAVVQPGGPIRVRISDEKVRDAFEAAFRKPMPTSLKQIALEIGYYSAEPLTRRFPELCMQLESLKKELVVAAFAAALQKEVPPPLTEIAKDLACGVVFLKNNFPDLCKQVIQLRRSLVTNRRDRVTASLKDALVEFPPPSLEEMSIRLGLSSRGLERLSPELSKQIANRSKEFIRERTLKKESDFRRLVRNAVIDLNSRGVYPTITKISLLVDLRTHAYTYISKLVHELRTEFELE